ncbi:MAG: Thiamine ABC transporter, permease protein, partial [uncultured bacterium]
MVSGLESSLWYSIVTVAISLLLGGGLAVAERLWQQSTPRWFLAVMMLPVFLPPLIISTSFILLPLRLYTPSAVILAFSYYNIPLAYVLVHSAAQRISAATTTAATLLGANRWQQWRTVLLPHLRVPILGTAGIIFLYCFTSFVLPLQLGGVHGQTLEVWLYQQIYIYHHYALASAVAFGQWFILITIIFISLQLQPILIMPKFIPEQTQSAQALFRGLHLLFAVVVLVPILTLAFKLAWSIRLTDFTTLLHGQFFAAWLRTLGITGLVIAINIAIVLISRMGTKTSLLLLSLSPITVSFIWYQLFGKGYISLIAALVVAALPMTAILLDQTRVQSRLFMTTARLLGASFIQRIY